MKRACLVTTLWLAGLVAAVPAWSQVSQDPLGTGRAPGRTTVSDRSRLQVTIMEDAFQRAVENTHSRQLEEIMPAMFSFDANPRARGFRIEGYGVFFDVDLPPIPRSVEWTLRALDTGAMMTPEIQQLKVLLPSITDPAVRRRIEPLVKTLETKAAAGPPTLRPDKDGNITVTQKPVADTKGGAPSDPFRGYVTDLTQALVQVMLDYGSTIQLAPSDWLTVAAREMQPRLMPGNPTEATITLRIKAGDLAALKAGTITTDEARKRVEVKEIY